MMAVVNTAKAAVAFSGYQAPASISAPATNPMTAVLTRPSAMARATL